MKVSKIFNIVLTFRDKDKIMYKNLDIKKSFQNKANINLSIMQQYVKCFFLKKIIISIIY